MKITNLGCLFVRAKESGIHASEIRAARAKATTVFVGCLYVLDLAFVRVKAWVQKWRGDLGTENRLRGCGLVEFVFVNWNVLFHFS